MNNKIKIAAKNENSLANFKKPANRYKVNEMLTNKTYFKIHMPLIDLKIWSMVA